MHEAEAGQEVVEVWKIHQLPYLGPWMVRAIRFRGSEVTGVWVSMNWPHRIPDAAEYPALTFDTDPLVVAMSEGVHEHAPAAGWELVSSAEIDPRREPVPVSDRVNNSGLYGPSPVGPAPLGPSPLSPSLVSQWLERLVIGALIVGGLWFAAAVVTGPQCGDGEVAVRDATHTGSYDCD